MQQRKSKNYLILDDYSGAVLAYSFRKLRDDYSGYCLKIRRLSDNATQDIGFINNKIDIDSASSFVGNNDATIERWYNQSGDSLDLIEPSLGGGPFLFISGIAIKVNNKIGSWFINNRYLKSSSNYPISTFLGSSYQNFTISVLYDHLSTLGTLISCGNTVGDPRFTIHAPYSGVIYYDSGLSSTRRISNEVPIGWLQKQHLLTCYSTGSNAFIRVDGQQLTTGGVTGTGKITNSYRVGLGAFPTESGSMNAHIGYIQEMIVYPLDKSTNLIGIERNINEYYRIYR